MSQQLYFLIYSKELIVSFPKVVFLEVSQELEFLD